MLRSVSFGTVLLSTISLMCLMSCSPHSHKERIEDSFNSHLTSGSDGSHSSDFDHEAVLGSKNAAKQFDALSPEESKKRLRILVNTGMDANKDGFVDKQELIEWILQSFRTLAIEDGNERLEEEDLNKDGVVSWEEHLKDTFDIEDSDEEQLLKDELMAEDKGLWNAADLNKDGVLDSEEFSAFNSPEEFQRMHKTIYEQMMSKKDKNKNGFLEFEEFLTDVNGIPLDPKSEASILERDRFRNDYDLDGDNRLNEKECLIWLIPDNREMAETEANHLISASDDNNDGKLSVDEIVEHNDVFVGSEATDFGQNLENMRFSDEL